ncbi:MAG: hypothetical protein D6768_12325, partial [Chloroflexi bacterium]
MDKQKTPSPVLRYGRNALIAIIIFAAYAFSWQVTEIDMPRLFTDFYKAIPIIQDFLTPELFARGERTQSYVIDYPVPCDAGEISQTPDSGPRIVATPPCSDPKTNI